MRYDDLLGIAPSARHDDERHIAFDTIRPAENRLDRLATTHELHALFHALSPFFTPIKN
jgi:hypothetical protein